LTSLFFFLPLLLDQIKGATKLLPRDIRKLLITKLKAKYFVVAEPKKKKKKKKKNNLVLPAGTA